MSKEIKIKIPDLKEVYIFLKNIFKNFFSWKRKALSFDKLRTSSRLRFASLGMTKLKAGMTRAGNDLKNKKWRGIIVLLLSACAFYLWGISSALLWLLFLLFLVYEWENRIIAVFALISLASCPFLLSFKQDAMAETMAVYAYFFLVMTVVLQIIEYKRHPERFPEEIDSPQDR